MKVPQSPTYAAIFLGINASPVLAKEVSTDENLKDGTEEADMIGLRKIEDGSVISNIHTSKWRVFTDNARDLFLQASNLKPCVPLFH